MIYKCNIFQNLCTCMCLLEASECSLFFCEVAASQIYALLFYPSFFIGFFFFFSFGATDYYVEALGTWKCHDKQIMFSEEHVKALPTATVLSRKIYEVAF